MTPQMLPETFTDFFGNKNDTLNYSVSIKQYSDYGNVRATLQNATYPLIVQLTDAKGDVKEEHYYTKLEVVEFLNVTPGKYYLRVIFDENKNNKFDSGNYLLKRQPERISYYPEELDIRAGWDEIIEFILLE